MSKRIKMFVSIMVLGTAGIYHLSTIAPAFAVDESALDSHVPVASKISNKEQDATFVTQFKYSHAWSAEKLYAEFRKTARLSCFQQYRDFPAYGKIHQLKKCRYQLLQQAISRMNRSDIMAMHQTRFKKIAHQK